MGKGPGEHGLGRLYPAQRRLGFTLLAAAFLLLLIAPQAGTQQLSNVGPSVVIFVPPDGATQVAPTTALSVTFSESVTLAAGAVSLICPSQQTFELTVAGGPTAYTILPDPPLPPGESCTATVIAYGVTDLGDPPAYMESDAIWRFTVATAAAVDVLINEIDATTTGPEFIELYDGGRGRTSLTGLQLALYDGSTDTIILTIPLRDKSTDADGYFLISADPATADLLLANGSLLDGPAAVALYAAPAGTLPTGSPPILTGLVDAVVYGSGPADSGLLPLLLTGQPQVDEDSRGQAGSDSAQRCPNGAGGPRQTTEFQARPPTPGTANVCLREAAPAIESTAPAAGSIVEPSSLQLEVAFSEPVAMSPGALTLTCTTSGGHDLTIAGGPIVFSATPTIAPEYGESCAATLVDHLISDLDTDDPPDHPGHGATWSFSMARRVATHILINEVDSDTPGPDTAEFIELYDGGQGQSDLTGLVVVLFNGATDTSYRAISLDTYATNGDGYFLIGNKGVANQNLLLPDAGLQNGPDAIALYAGQAGDFPNGTGVTTNKLIDAVVYGSPDKPDNGLLSLLVSGQKQVDEDERGQPEQHANQRCPNGSGGQRQTAAFHPNNPTPGKANVCTTDDPPRIISTVPAANASGIAALTQVSVTFSEPVTLKKEWITLDCAKTGAHTGTTSGGATTWTVTLTTPVVAGETCQATVFAAQVTDSDSDDPPDSMAANWSWSFSTKAITIADFVLINEVDADTPGVDKAEFVELYDGGVGRTPLDGLTLVLFNGNGAVSYAAVGLDGSQTDASGYFVIGNTAISPHLVVPDGMLQNGPDAIGLFAAAPTAFPTGTPVSTGGLVDAVVYGSDAPAELRALLNAAQPAVDEDDAGTADTHSLQRCPDGSGGRRNSVTIGVGKPSPGAANHCLTDEPPRVVTTSPAADATGIAIDAAIDVTFSEPVSLAAGIKVICDRSGAHAVAVSGGPEIFTLTPSLLLTAEQCQVTIPAASVTDLDAFDPPDTMSSDVSWSFQTVGPVATGILINEFDVDTPGTDTAEFIELFDGGRGRTSLDGLIIVLFDGQGDTSYRALDLSGTQTDSAGYLVIGGPDVANRTVSLPSGALQNGPDAIALFAGDPQDYPNNTAITTRALLDAVVYGTADPGDPGLLPLLLAGQSQIDESGLGDSAAHANQRCPNGEGGARMTAGFRQAAPTPGATNACTTDDAPAVMTVSPVDAAVGVSPNTVLTVTFSEPVTTEANWLQLGCTTSGHHTLAITGGPLVFTATPVSPPVPGESCNASVLAARIHDVDAADPPDTPAADMIWSFSLAPALCEQPTTPIQTIQGTGFSSPLLGDTVIVEVVVTADFRESLGGLFVQAPADGSPVSADASGGLFVRLAPKAGVVAGGDRLILSGRVAERDQRTTLDGATVVALCGRGETVTPVKLLPSPRSPDAWEAVESMLVTQGPAVIADNSALGTDGVLSLVEGQRPIYPSDMLPPGEAAWVALQENQQRLWLLDDGRFGEPADPTWATAGTPWRTGDTLPNIIGVVDGFEGGRRIHALEQPPVLATNPRPLAPATLPAGLRLVSVDLGLFSNGDGQGGSFVDPGGAGSAAEYQRQSDKIVAMLSALDADLIALNGLENDGEGPTSTLIDLLHELNSVVAQPYAAITVNDPPANHLFAVQSVLLYRSDSLSLTTEIVPAAVATLAGHVAHPLLVRVTDSATGQQFDIAVIHLRPRDDCPLSGPDADQQDGQACHNAARSEAATAFAGWLSARATVAQTLLVGCWNAYGFEGPVQAATTVGFHDKTPTGDYTQAEGGQIGATQRLLVGSSLGGHLTQTAIWHINADESPIFDYHLGNPPALFAPDPYRSAKTDPLVVDLRLGSLTAGFVTQPTVLIGQTSHFRNTSTGPGPLHYRWDFGDGSLPATSSDAAHTYRHIGTYTVTLTVSNSVGSATLSDRVDVLPRRVYLPAASAMGPLHQSSMQR